MFQVIWEVLTTWYIIALLILLGVLVGVLIYMKRQEDED
jgi:hypothetical protein